MLNVNVFYVCKCNSFQLNYANLSSDLLIFAVKYNRNKELNVNLLKTKIAL